MTDIIRETHCPHCGATTQITEGDLDWAAGEVAKGEAVAAAVKAKLALYAHLLDRRVHHLRADARAKIAAGLVRDHDLLAFAADQLAEYIKGIGGEEG